MKDRIPKYPGRVKMTPVEGQANTFDMIRADEPEQEGTPLNKATLLTDDTASLFGLGEGATVDGVLGSASRVYQHCWEKAPFIYELSKGAYSTKRLTSFSMEEVENEDTTAYWVSATCVVNDDGTLTLVSPEVVSIGWYNGDYAANMKGKYFVSYVTENLKTVYFAHATNAAINRTTATESGEERYICNLTNVCAVTTVKSYGEWELVFSPSADTYPDGEGEDGEYKYLGVPFDKAVRGARIETGSYVGTGTFGSSANMSSLTFGFEPRVVIIGVNDAIEGYRILALRGMTRINPDSTGSNPGAVTLTWSGNTVSWWAQHKADYQMNRSGSTYYYLAIG